MGREGDRGPRLVANIRMAMAYAQRRAAALAAIGMAGSGVGTDGKVDKSPKGSLDAPIRDLVEHINRTEAWFTTSSCSGRTSLFLLERGRKKGGRWIYVRHGEADAKELHRSVQQGQEGLATFRFEPFILTVECRTPEDAFVLVALAIQTGYKASGVTSIGKRNLVSIRGSTRLEVPVAKDGEWLVSKEYLDFLVEQANQKWTENKDRIDRFFKTLQEYEAIQPSFDPAARLQTPNGGDG